MAKFYGKLGFLMTYESKPGVWVDSYAEMDAYGDFIQNTYMLKGSNKVNDDVNALYIISVVVDSYAMENLRYLKYVYYNGISWKIARVKAEYPRLIITLDGDPFTVDLKIPTDRKSAEDYANNIIQTGIKSLRCSLDKEMLTIDFTPIKDRILAYYLHNNLVDMYIALLVHNSSLMCNDDREKVKGGHHDSEWIHKNDINIYVTSTQHIRKDRNLFNKRMLFKKKYHGITYIKLTAESISKGKVELNLYSLLNIEYIEGEDGKIIKPIGYIPKYYNRFVSASIDRYNVKSWPLRIFDQHPEQTFSCELFTLCKIHEKNFNEDADVLYYEHDESLRKISDNTVTYIYNIDA